MLTFAIVVYGIAIMLNELEINKQHCCPKACCGELK